MADWRGIALLSLAETGMALNYVNLHVMASRRTDKHGRLAWNRVAQLGGDRHGIDGLDKNSLGLESHCLVKHRPAWH